MSHSLCTMDLLTRKGEAMVCAHDVERSGLCVAERGAPDDRRLESQADSGCGGNRGRGRRARHASADDDQPRSRASNDQPAKPRRRRRGEANAELGRRGEDAAARYLYKRGYDIVERNWVCPAGEADIIARDESCLVFVEVKTRTSVEHGFPSEAVDKEKRERYEKIAAFYLQDHDVVDIPFRFDVVSLLTIADDRAMIRHHINAFGTD